MQKEEKRKIGREKCFYNYLFNLWKKSSSPPPSLMAEPFFNGLQHLMGSALWFFDDKNCRNERNLKLNKNLGYFLKGVIMKNKKGQTRKEIETKRMMIKSSQCSSEITGEEAKKMLVEISELLGDAGIKSDAVMGIASCDIVVRIKYLLLVSEAFERENLHLKEMLENIGDDS